MASCEETSVGTVIVIDRSRSMLQPMNDVLSNKFETARLISRSFIDALLSKDNLAIQGFADSPVVSLGMTNDESLLTDTINALESFGTDLEAKGSSNIAAALELAYATLEACAPATATASLGEGVDAGEAAAAAEASLHNFHGNGPPAAGLGVAGDTYVDDDNGALYWKSESGWHP